MNDKEVIRALKSERCPPSVLKRVRAVIGSDKTSTSRNRWSIPAAITVATGILLILFLINIPHDPLVKGKIATKNISDTIDKAANSGRIVDDYATEAEELKFVLTYIGLTLESETERNRDIILRSTVPAVKDSIEDTGKYINNKIWGKNL